MLKDALEGKPIGHPLHPALVHLPVGLFAISFLLDVALAAGVTDGGLARATVWTMGLGVVTALVAAVAGFADYTDIRRDHPAKRTATLHMVLNLVVVALFALNAWLRYRLADGASVPKWYLLLTLAGIGLLSVSGYLGGRLVYADGIAIGRHRRRAPLPERTRKFEGKVDEFVEVADADELVEGSTLRVELHDTVMTVARVGGRVYAFQEFCTHRFGPLSEGVLEDHTVKCPWHGSCFDVRTGKVVQGPAKVDIKTFDAKIENGHVLVKVVRHLPNQ